MTVVQLVILPGILLAALVAGVLVIAARLARGRLREMAVRRRASEVAAAKWQAAYNRLGALSVRQGDVIAAVIGELEARPATYKTFPDSLRSELFAAHESATQTEKDNR